LAKLRLQGFETNSHIKSGQLKARFFIALAVSSIDSLSVIVLLVPFISRIAKTAPILAMSP
jgi:hypothetical protein